MNPPASQSELYLSWRGVKCGGMLYGTAVLHLAQCLSSGVMSSNEGGQTCGSVMLVFVQYLISPHHRMPISLSLSLSLSFSHLQHVFLSFTRCISHSFCFLVFLFLCFAICLAGHSLFSSSLSVPLSPFHSSSFLLCPSFSPSCLCLHTSLTHPLSFTLYLAMSHSLSFSHSPSLSVAVCQGLYQCLCLCHSLSLSRSFSPLPFSN